MISYDYVVVGAGSAGCVLAARLSEDLSTKVLLLEAGGPDRAREIHIPVAFGKLFKGPNDWAYFTEEQPRLKGRKLFWPRGKVLGGSSAINAMIYIRGNHADYDEWRDAGNAGWGFADLLPCFKRSENQARGASEYHGAGGPLDVSDLRTVNPVSRAFVEAGVEVGLPANDDFNGPRQEGVGFYQVTQRNGRRCSAATGFLRPALRRSNLTVLTHAQATRVLVERGRATGVEYVLEGRTERATAGREVILSGGAINSPQLLLLSGIGPADELRALGIAVTADVPGVGRHLEDHLFVAMVYQCTKPVTLASAESVGNLARYLLLKKGPLTSNVAEAGGFARLGGSTAPDVQLLSGPVAYINHGFTPYGGHGFTIGAVLLRPKSNGRVMLRSADPFEAPAIDPRYLEDEEDLRVLVEGVRLCRTIAGTRAFDALRGKETHPGPAAESDAEIAEHVRTMAETLYHPVGTCRMGEDASAVVDAQLRVRGVEGLRVVDASVMPHIVRGNTNAPTIAIAEKAADLIRRA